MYTRIAVLSLVLCIHVTMALAQIGSVSMTSPNGGETWTAGATSNITFTRTGNITSIDLQYTTNNGSSWTTIASPQPSTSPYAWSIPATINSTQCKLKILGYYNGQTVLDESNAVFTIKVPIGTVTITSPNGGETWSAGTTKNVTFSRTGNITSIDLQYSTNNGGSWTTISSPQPSTSPYAWSIPATINSTQCKLKVLGYYNGQTVLDESNAVFTIKVPIGTVAIVSPNGGEVWTAGTTNNVTFTRTGNLTSIDLQYTTNNGNSWTTISTPQPSTSPYTWTIPPTIQSTQCKLKILGYYNGQTVLDESNAVFTIKVPIGTVVMTSPNGGETWTAGTTRNVTFTRTGNLTSIDLQYTTNNGISWTTISSPQPSTSPYAWAIPATIHSTDCKLKILGYYNGQTVLDESNTVFTILVPIGTAAIISPNGGETWVAGTTNKVTFTRNGNISSIDLQYSTNNGSSWTTISSPQPSTSPYSWWVPMGSNSSEWKFKIIAYYNGAMVVDESDGTFTVAPLKEEFFDDFSYSTNADPGLSEQGWTIVHGSNGPPEGYLVRSGQHKVRGRLGSPWQQTDCPRKWRRREFP